MKKIIYALGILFLATSCNDDGLTSLNVDKKNPSVVPAYTLFSNAERTIADQMTSTNVNRNIFRLVNQQWTETTYLDESNYEWTSRKISDNHSNALFSGPLADLNQAKIYLEKDVISASDPDFANKTIIKKNQLILIDILMVYTYQILVDTFGDVPYSEALQGSSDYLPKYDKAEDIYKDLIVRLNKDLATIDVSNVAFGSGEMIYKDDLTLWVKFANGIKLKLGINLKASGLDTAIADAAITSAATGVFTSNADNAKFVYMSDVPNTNPLYVDMVFSGRHDFVVAKPFLDPLVAKNDPRKSIYFASNKIPFIGGVVGVKNSFSKFTHVSDLIQTPSFAFTYLDYSEVEFLLAEAAERGLAVGSAGTHYTNAITASMEDWGVNSADIDTYLAQPTVDYATATGTWQQKIGEQSWYALFNRGFEGWTSTRRLDFPVLVAPATAAPAAEGKVPVRMTYPIREQTLNPTNYKAAAIAIGGDKLTTRIFWDKF
jgi:hypothetical protein